jgi:hypothetical protein
MIVKPAGESRFGHARHVVRVAVLFASGFVTFLLVRQALVPADFGAYGFYRGGALADAASLPITFAGQAACVDCHDAVVQARHGSKHERVRCEACHGALAQHASGDVAAKPKTLNPRTLCLTCHVKSSGKPEGFPQIVPADHAEEGPCTACHQPHAPRIG